MIINLERVLNIVSLVCDFLTLQTALSPRHLPHSQMVLPPSRRN